MKNPFKRALITTPVDDEGKYWDLAYESLIVIPGWSKAQAEYAAEAINNYARVLDQRDRATSIVTELQWGDMDECGDSICPECLHVLGTGHRADCSIALLLMEVEDDRNSAEEPK